MRFGCLISLKPEPPQLFVKMIGYAHKWEEHVMFLQKSDWLKCILYLVLTERENMRLQIVCFMA